MGDVNGFTSPWDTYARLSGLRSVTLFLFPCDCGKSDLHQGADGAGGYIVYCKSCLKRAPLGAETSREREWHWNCARYARLERERDSWKHDACLLMELNKSLLGAQDRADQAEAELTRLRAVEARTVEVREAMMMRATSWKSEAVSRWAGEALALFAVSLAEACGRKG